MSSAAPPSQGSSTHARAGAEVLPPAYVEEVAPGCFAYIQPDGSWWINNAGFLVGSDGVSLIDTTSTEARGRALLAAVEHTAGPKPLRTLVNTHFHGDHTHANWLVPGATIVGHEECRRGVLDAGVITASSPLNQLFPGVEWGELHPAPPFLTFTERLTLWVDDLEVQLIHTGPAHTTSDVVLWIPEYRLLYAGDLVFNGGTPFVMMGSVAGSLATTEDLRALGAETIVPGHGPVCGPSALDTVKDYLRFVTDTAERAHGDGISPLEAAQAADLGQFAELTDSERLAGNLHRAYAEIDGAASGAPINLAAAMGDMITLNGGRPLRCLA